MKTKLCFLLSIILVFSVLTTIALAEPVSVSSDADDESSAIVLEEPENKKLEWAYWLIGGGAIFAVVVFTVVVSKKVK